MSEGEFCYRYPRPAVTVDMAVFAWVDHSLRVLVIRRRGEPFAGCWALPGGFVEPEESFEAAARRELKEETSLTIRSPLRFVGVYGEPGRDPRGWTISIAHAVACRAQGRHVEGGDDAAETRWLPLDHPGESLAFDHELILSAAREVLKSEVERGRWGPALLPTRFTPLEVRSMLRAVGVTTRTDVWLRRMIKFEAIRQDDDGCFDVLSRG